MLFERVVEIKVYFENRLHVLMYMTKTLTQITSIAFAPLGNG